MKKNTFKKLTKYVTSSAAVLAIGASADAAIVYTNIVDEDLAWQGDNFAIDIDNGGTNDFRFNRGGFFTFTYSGFSYQSDRAGLGGYNAGSSYNRNQVLVSSSYNKVKNLSSSYTISNAASNWRSDSYYNSNNIGQSSNYSGGYYNGNIAGNGASVIGVKFDINGEWHYGWIKVSYDFYGAFTIQDYAYEACPGVAIIAGATSGGPATCPPPPVASECENATEITCGSTVTGNTVGNTPQTFGTCGTNAGTGGAIWYHFVGDGGNWFASTDYSGTNFDTKLWLFSGDCNALNCEDGDDDGAPGNFSNNSSELTFSTTLGEDYYLVIGGFSSSEGNYELELTCDNPCPAALFTQDVDGCESVIYDSVTYTSNTTLYDTLAGQSSNGCDSIVRTNINVGQPATIDIGNDLTICESDGSANLNVNTSSNIVGGIWSTNGSGSFSDSSSASPTYFFSSNDISAGMVTIYAEGISEGCDNPMDTMVINITPTPTVSAGADIQLCTGTTSLDLNGVISNAAGGEWTTLGQGNFVNEFDLNAVYNIVGTDVSGVTLELTTTGNGICSAATDQVSISFGSEAILTYDITACDEYEVYGIVRTTSDTYRDTITGSGCDTIMVTNLTLGQTTTSSQAFEINPGESVVVGGVTYTEAAVIKDTLVNTTNCDSIITTTITVADTTTQPTDGILDLTRNNIKVSPNPSNGVFNLDLSQINSEYVDLILIDNLGRTIENKTKVSTKSINSLDLSNYDNGVYFLFVRNEETNVSIKLIKNN